MGQLHTRLLRLHFDLTSFKCSRRVPGVRNPDLRIIGRLGHVLLAFYESMFIGKCSAYIVSIWIIYSGIKRFGSYGKGVWITEGLWATERGEPGWCFLLHRLQPGAVCVRWGSYQNLWPQSLDHVTCATKRQMWQCWERLSLVLVPVWVCVLVSPCWVEAAAWPVRSFFLWGLPVISFFLWGLPVISWGLPVISFFPWDDLLEPTLPGHCRGKHVLESISNVNHDARII